MHTRLTLNLRELVLNMVGSLVKVLNPNVRPVTTALLRSATDRWASKVPVSVLWPIRSSTHVSHITLTLLAYFCSPTEKASIARVVEIMLAYNLRYVA